MPARCPEGVPVLARADSQSRPEVPAQGRSRAEADLRRDLVDQDIRILQDATSVGQPLVRSHAPTGMPVVEAKRRWKVRVLMAAVRASRGIDQSSCKAFVSDFVGNTLTDTVFGVVPVAGLIVAAVVIAWSILRRTDLGVALYTVGTDEASASLSGVRVARTRFLAFVGAGMVYGVSAVSGPASRTWRAMSSSRTWRRWSPA